jgi:hypothetical protein
MSARCGENADGEIEIARRCMQCVIKRGFGRFNGERRKKLGNLKPIGNDFEKLTYNGERMMMMKRINQ